MTEEEIKVVRKLQYLARDLSIDVKFYVSGGNLSSATRLQKESAVYYRLARHLMGIE